MRCHGKRWTVSRCRLLCEHTSGVVVNAEQGNFHAGVGCDQALERAELSLPSRIGVKVRHKDTVHIFREKHGFSTALVAEVVARKLL